MPVATARRVTPIEIVFGLGGQNSSPNPASVPVTDLVRATNVTFSDDTVQKEGGAAKLNTTAISGTPKIVGLHDFYNASGTKFLIAALSDGSVVTVVDGGIGETLLAVGTLQADRQTVFVEGVTATVTKRLYIFNGRDLVRFTQGTAATTGTFATTDAADWAATDNSVNQPTAGIIHRNRLVAWGNENDPHRLYFSLANTDHQDFTTTALSLSVYPGEGERIAACISFLGRLYIFKFPFGVYWVDEGLTADLTSVWQVRRLTKNVGMVGPLGLTYAEGDVLFVGNDGLIHALSGVKEFGDARDSTLLYDKTSTFLHDHVNRGRLGRAVVAYYAERKECHIALSEGGTVNDRRAVLDLRRPGQPMFRWSDRDVCEALAIRRDSTGIHRVMMGDEAGVVWELDRFGRNKAGIGYTGEFWTKPIPIMGGLRRGNLHYLDVTATMGPGQTKVTIDVELDGQVRQTLNYSIGGAALILDSGALDVGVLGGEPDETRTVRKRVTGDARYVRLRCRNGVVDENFSISRMVLWVSPGNQRP